MKILNIEDELSLADALSTRLKKNYSVDIKTDGLDGYYYATSNIYDLIILDVMLPNMDGFKILKKLRNEKRKWIKEYKYSSPLMNVVAIEGKKEEDDKIYKEISKYNNLIVD